MYTLNNLSLKGRLRYQELPQTQAEPQMLHSALHTFCTAAIEDSSTSKTTITVHGRVLSSPVSPFEQHYSALFSGGFLSTPASTNFALGDNFTVECWVKPREISGETVLFDIGSSDRAGFLRVSSQCVPYTSVHDTKTLVPKNATLSINTWTHLAICADSNGIRLYMNGTRIATSKSAAGWPTDGKRLYIGADCGGGCAYNGYMSNLRLFKGVALYNTAFTPPTAPLSSSIPQP